MDTFSTMEPLNSILRFVGLSCIVRHKKKLAHSWSFYRVFFCIFTLTIVNILCLYLKFYINGGLSSFSFKDVIQLVYLLGYIQYITDLYFVFKNRQIYLDYLNMYDHIDKILGVNYTSVIKPKITTTGLLFLGSDVFCSIFDYSVWLYFHGWVIPTIDSVEYIYYVFKSLSGSDIIANLIQLEYRIKAIGDLLENYRKDNNISSVKLSNEVKIVVEPLKEKAHKLNLATLKNDRPEVITWITRCYLLILDQAETINNIFGFRLLVTSVVILLTLIIILNIIIRLLLGLLKVQRQVVKYYLMASNILRVISCCFVVNCGIYRFERCYREEERIIRIIDRTVINNNISASSEHALRVLRELLQSRPLSFHAYNFYRLDYTFLVSVSSATVTYTIILLQNMQ